MEILKDDSGQEFCVLSPQKSSVLFKITDLSLESGKGLKKKKKGLSGQQSLERTLSWMAWPCQTHWNFRRSTFRMEILTHLIFKKKHFPPLSLNL